jgi:hypothetical protein
VNGPAIGKWVCHSRHSSITEFLFAIFLPFRYAGNNDDSAVNAVGRPRYVSEAGKQAVATEVLGLDLGGGSKNVEEIVNIVKKRHESEVKHRGKNPLGGKSPTRRAMQKLVNEVAPDEKKNVKPQTKKRADTRSDVRTQVSLAALWPAVVGRDCNGVDSRLVVNWDKTGLLCTNAHLKNVRLSRDSKKLLKEMTANVSTTAPSSTKAKYRYCQFMPTITMGFRLICPMILIYAKDGDHIPELVRIKVCTRSSYCYNVCGS